MPRRIYTYQPNLGWNNLNLTETVGAYILLIGLAATAFNAVRAMRRPADAPDNPWGGETLEWAVASPPKVYDFPVIPTVYSQHPMWDEKTLASLARHREDPERTLTEEKEAMRTSDLDSVPQFRLPLPEESHIPVLAALSLLLGTVLLFVQVPYAAAGFGAVAAVLFAVWLWPRPTREQEESES
jgi:cytochrome c oxidase subunit 1/cytochrome c oxidase subunit I+III